MAAHPSIWTRVALLALLAGMVSGCNPGLPRVLRVAKSTTDPGELNMEESMRDRHVVKEVATLLQDFDPGLRLYPTSISQANLIKEIRRQTGSGLGPDLIITNGTNALALLDQTLTEPVTLTPKQKAQISPIALERVTTPGGVIAGIPMSQYVQLACYDKRRLPTPPKTLKALETASSQGKVFGFAMHLEDLYWTLGGFAATSALQTSLDQQATSAADSRRLLAWLDWMRSASFQQNVLFLNDQMGLRSQFIQGKLDWITCWSSQLPQLRAELKEHLGITTLPSGPIGQATPITRLQVWSLGRNSSARQRRESIALLQFMVEPWAQKTMALKYRTSFPINPQVAPIVQRQLAGEHFISNDSVELGLTDKPSTRHANTLLAALGAKPEQMKRVNSILNSVVFGTSTSTEAAEALQTSLREEQP